jgi:hypothetical protein
VAAVMRGGVPVLGAVMGVTKIARNSTIQGCNSFVNTYKKSNTRSYHVIHFQ